eukprot:sb/3465813/
MAVYPYVPATLGKNVEIRCSALYFTSYQPYYYNSYCPKCGIYWEFEGESLQNSSRVQINQFYSKGFAALTPESVATAKQVGLTTQLNFNWEDYQSDYYYSSSGNLTEGIAYLNSIITISGVTSDDLGTYTCNYTDLDDFISSRNTTLYEGGPTVETNTTTGIYSRLNSEVDNPSTIYAQCITSGGPPVWKARVATNDCPSYYTTTKNFCEETSMMGLDDLKKQDFYHCFNFTEATSSDGFSVIKFTDVSCESGELDDIVFYCLQDLYSDRWSFHLEWQGYFSLTQAKENAVDEQDYRYQRIGNNRREEEFVMGVIVVPVLMSCIIIAALIIASVRGKCCYSRRTLFATPISVPVSPTGAPVTMQEPPAYSG